MASVVGYDESAKTRVTCKARSSRPGCGAIIEYTRQDVKSYSGTDYSGGSDGSEWIDCPGCGQQIILRSW